MKTASWFTFFSPGRVGISRGIPRNIASGYRVYRKLSPGPWLRKVSPEEYNRLFLAEILAPLDPEETWEQLHALVAPHEPVLLCWERPPFTATNRCHRRTLVAPWFEQALGVVIDELPVPAAAGRRGCPA